MFLMCADPLRGQVGGGRALEIEFVLGPVKRNGIEPLGERHLGKGMKEETEWKDLNKTGAGILEQFLGAWNRIGTEVVLKFQRWRLREEGKGERVKRT
jgi:hypothetical protein